MTSSSSQEQYALGRRISVRGATGSGKTTFARDLGARLGLGVIEMDDLFWNPGWVDTPAEEFRRKLLDAIQALPDGWVCDGNYQGRSGDIVLIRADTLIWLHLPLRVSFWRAIKRSFGRAWTKEPMWSWRNIETWSNFLSRQSILWLSLEHHRSHERSVRGAISRAPLGLRVYELRTAAEVDALLDSVTRSRSTRLERMTREELARYGLDGGD